MSRHRFFLTAPLSHTAPGADVLAPLSAEDLHHAVRVLRLRIAEEIDVVEPAGAAWRVRVTATEQDGGLRVEVLEACEVAAEPDVTLVFGVLKGSKNEDVIEGAVEVGVSAIVPVLTARCIVRLDAGKRADRGDRWRRVVRAAAKQSKRSLVPALSDPVELAEVSALLGAFDLVLVAWEEAAGSGLSQRLRDAGLPPHARVAVVVGPEGGLAAQEVAALEKLGAVTCSLGATILRAETAGVVASALVVHELGGLGARTVGTA